MRSDFWSIDTRPEGRRRLVPFFRATDKLPFAQRLRKHNLRRPDAQDVATWSFVVDSQDNGQAYCRRGLTSLHAVELLTRWISEVVLKGQDSTIFRLLQKPPSGPLLDSPGSGLTAAAARTKADRRCAQQD
ncbi:MAG: hypothetical protein ACRDK3_10215 [Actinomycetota bacterium]